MTAAATVGRMRRQPTTLSVTERDALTFGCPRCRQRPGEWCLTDMGQVAPQLHRGRIELA